MPTPLRWLDMPPVWLAAMVAGAFALDLIAPGLGFGLGWMQSLGTLLVGLGLALMAFAVWEFLRARTTIIPREVPTAFVRRGIYRWTRNPIYLGDALILAGLVLRWDVLPALVLVPLFIAVITQRFVLGEEAGLKARFGKEFTIWAGDVRRWI